MVGGVKEDIFVVVVPPLELRLLLLATARRDLIAAQLAVDKDIFDPSLGCPLASFENATLGLVGGKALQCWRLTKHGYQLPPSFILPTYVYSLHVDDAGVAPLIHTVFASVASAAAASAGTAPAPAKRNMIKLLLGTIRNKILTTPLNPEVIENLELFLDTLNDGGNGNGNGSCVAVRSSSTAEDLEAQSFAGQYDTCK